MACQGKNGHTVFKTDYTYDRSNSGTSRWVACVHSVITYVKYKIIETSWFLGAEMTAVLQSVVSKFRDRWRLRLLTKPQADRQHTAQQETPHLPSLLTSPRPSILLLYIPRLVYTRLLILHLAMGPSLLPCATMQEAPAHI